MRVVFRVDASTIMGTGHTMRCLSLSEALQERGAECHFICRKHQGHLLDSIAQRGFSTSALGHEKTTSTSGMEKTERLPRHAHWLGCDWRLDGRQTAAILSVQRPDWLIVDHYALDCAWEKMQKSHVKKIMIIDDLADRHHDCDVLLDQNLGRQEIDYRSLVAEETEILVGLRFALLRSEFVKARTGLITKTGVVGRVLVFFGGVDPDNLTVSVLEALSVDEFSHLKVEVVIGGSNPNRTSVLQQVRNRPDTRLHIQVSNMAELMTQADLFVGAVGFSTWERCAVGLPGVCIPMARNQVAVSRFLQENELSICLNFKQPFLNDWLNGIRELTENHKLRRTMSSRLSSLIDAEGTARIADRIMQEQGEANDGF